jgi:hypothetical protein
MEVCRVPLTIADDYQSQRRARSITDPGPSLLDRRQSRIRMFSVTDALGNARGTDIGTARRLVSERFAYG